MEPIELSDKLIYSSEWMGYPVQSQVAPLHEGYLFNILGVMEKAIRDYPTVLAIRFDLRLPEGFDSGDTAVISRFFASLKSQIHEDYLRHAEKGKYVPRCKLRHMWAKERGSWNEGLHYHVGILLNYKRYAVLGNYRQGHDLDISEAQRNWVNRIRKAWMSATWGMARPSLVHFCRDGRYVLKRDSPEFRQQKHDLFYRLSYLAKTYTKEMVTGRKFGCSRS